MDTAEVNELIERTKAESLARRRAAAQELRALLLKEGKPGKGDHARLLELAGVLDIKTDQLPEVLEVLQKLERYDRMLSEREERVAAHKRAVVALRDFDSQVEAARARAFDEAAQKRLPLATEENKAASRIRELQEPRQWRGTVAAKWSAIVQGISYDEAFEQMNPQAVPHGGAVQAPELG